MNDYVIDLVAGTDYPFETVEGVPFELIMVEAKAFVSVTLSGGSQSFKMNRGDHVEGVKASKLVLNSASAQRVILCINTTKMKRFLNATPSTGANTVNMIAPITVPTGGATKILDTNVERIGCTWRATGAGGVVRLGDSTVGAATGSEWTISTSHSSFGCTSELYMYNATGSTLTVTVQELVRK